MTIDKELKETLHKIICKTDSAKIRWRDLFIYSKYNPHKETDKYLKDVIKHFKERNLYLD